MADRKERICVVCKERYKYCPRCQEDRDKELWHFSFHDLNCKNIYNVLSSYEDGRLSAFEAKAQLANLDLSKIENFGESYKKSIAKIYDEIARYETEHVTEEPVVTSEEINDTVSEKVEDEVETKVEETTNKAKNYRKSKKRTSNDVE